MQLLLWAYPFLKRIIILLRGKNSFAVKAKINGRVDPNPPALLTFKGGDLSEEIEIAKREHPQINIQSIDLAFTGSEQLTASDKKILIVHI